jgi:hypothetical protein
MKKLLLIALCLLTSSAILLADENCEKHCPDCNPPENQTACASCSTTFACTSTCTCPGLGNGAPACVATATAAYLSCIGRYCITHVGGH